jgi:replication factor C subunit 2/4
MKARLKRIAESENCSTKEDELDYILKLCDGDMRRAVTTLQSAHALGGHVNKDALAEMAGLPPFKVVDTLWSELKNSSFTSTQVAVEDVCAGGYSALVILVALSKRVVTCTELCELSKANISILIADAEKNLVDGADEYLQLMTVCSLVMTCMEESKTSKR